MRGALVRSLAVFGVGAAILVGILYYASTVDARPPLVLSVGVTQHLSTDSRVALTTTSIEVVFSEPVQPMTAESAFRISPATRGAFSWSGTQMTFTPAARLPLRTSFVVRMQTGVRDRAGNSMAAPSAAFSFETVGNPTVLASDPADGDQQVALDAHIQIDFSTLMDTASVDRALIIVPAIQTRLRWSGELLSIEPIAALEPNQLYAVRLTTDAHDQAGTPLQQEFTLSFQTVREGLSAVTLVPADQVEGVAGTTPIAVIFDGPLDPSSVSGSLLTITPAVAGSLDAVAAPGAAGLSDAGPRILRFLPSGPLRPNTTYEVHLAPGLRGADGVRLASELSWSFTTGAPVTTLSNQIVFLSDRAGVSNLWAMNPDGTNQRQLSAELSPVTDYAIAPDGRSFVVSDGAVLVLQRADTSNRRLLTEAGTLEFDPAFSADGATVVFSRADPATGSGLGLWTRSADGGDPRAVQLPAGASPSPTATPTAAASGSVAPLRAPLLRAPRYSPDGSALAFVDEAGRLEVLNLATGHVVVWSLFAVTPPVWLADSSALVVSTVPIGPGTPARQLDADSAPAPLDPAALPLTADQLRSLRVVRVQATSGFVTTLPFSAGATRPAVDATGRISYVTLDSGDNRAGRLWLSAADGATSIELLRTDNGSEATTGFAPERGTLVIGRAAPSLDAEALAGVWLLDVFSDV
ncbi:MAG: Ig-like domain-containing protein, partial [Chloroflexota bacterium]|nr:Ig-like domain-containing protein [Chloroflexota bacterium]